MTSTFKIRPLMKMSYDLRQIGITAVVVDAQVMRAFMKEYETQRADMTYAPETLAEKARVGHHFVGTLCGVDVYTTESL
jgi:hypothetical protein